MTLKRIIICFAVKQEAAGLRAPDGAEVLVTGMGATNAERSIRTAISESKPGLVLTCGFAGGLRRGLTCGTVIVSGKEPQSVVHRLHDAGALSGRLHCADRVATTAQEKRALWHLTGADGVEMESGIISKVCRDAEIPCVIVRVILDTAEEDLPLDFNDLIGADGKTRYTTVATLVARGLVRIPALLRFQRQTQLAARELGNVLNRALS